MLTLLEVDRVMNREVKTGAGYEVNFDIHYWGFREKHYDNPVHRHSFYEICYVISGKGEYEDEGTVYSLQQGSQFVSLPGKWHQIRSVEGIELYYVAFDPAIGVGGELALQQYVDRLLEYAGVTPVIVENENMSALLWRAIKLHAEQQAFPRLIVLAGLLLASFPDVFAPEGGSAERERPSTSSQSQLMERAKWFIRDNLSQPIKVGDLSSLLHLSERHFSRMFVKETGLSFVEYLNRERLKAAEVLLKTIVLTIAEVAEATGFQSVHYFTRVFSSYYGIPPAAYRKQCLHEKE